MEAGPQQNIIAQPCNRDTGIGILLAVLRILQREPLARIVFLPADHYIRDEAAFAVSLRAVIEALHEDPDSLVLLGVRPERTDCDLGYILPGTRYQHGAWNVARFVEKPDAP